MPTPGLLYVLSKPKSNITEENFNKWYTDFHIGDVVSTGVSDLAIRYKNTSANAKWPYLAVYRLPDVGIINDPNAFEKVQLNHELLPNGGPWQDALDVDMAFFTLIQSFEGQIPKDGPRGKALRTVTVEPSDDADFDDWYRRQHLDMLSMVPGYRRSTRYKLADEKNEAGRARFLALHEYDTKEFPAEAVKLVTGTEWSKKILGSAKSFGGDLWEEIAVVGATESKL
jgi:hypothetical protein